MLEVILAQWPVENVGAGNQNVLERALRKSMLIFAYSADVKQFLVERIYSIQK